MSLRGSLRSLASRPVLPAVAVATLALGLGVNAAIFSLTREVLLRPLPYRDVDRLVWVSELGRTGGPVAPVNYVAWRNRLEAFEQTATFRRKQFNVSMKTSAVQVEGFLVAPEFFPLLGVQPVLGRGFAEGEAQPGRDTVVLLGHGFWRRQFAADPAVVGHTIDVDGIPCTVVGVLPSSFQIFHVLNREVDLFRVFAFDPTDREQSLNVYARLKPGASLDAARSQMAVAYASLPAANRTWTGDVEPLSRSFTNQSRPTLIALQWAVALVLLIACANIANLLLAVSTGRRKELAVRQALGASRWRIAKDLGAETLLMTAAGGTLAIVLAHGIVAVLNTAVSFQAINRLQPFRVDGWVLAFTGGLTLAVTLIFSLFAARMARETPVIDALKDSTHGVSPGVSNRRLRLALVVGELGLAIVLTTTALALTRSVLALHNFARGFSAEHVMTAQVSFNHPRYADTDLLVRSVSTTVDRLRSAPGISAAALVNYLPVSLIRLIVPVAVDGHAPPAPDRSWIARYWITSPDYFRVAGIPIRAGRDFTMGDDAMRPSVAIVSESFARRFWNRIDVVGQRLKTDFPRSDLFWIPRARRDWLTIVGVVGDVREDGLPGLVTADQVYLPYAQNSTTVVTLIARAEGLAGTAAPAIRNAVAGVDPETPVSYEASFEDVIRESLARPREMAWLVGAFAGLALVLSAIGVYGVMAYLTASRTQEIGIRMALGAAPLDIVSLILRQAMVPTAIGVSLGVVVAPMAMRLTSGFLFGVSPFDPTTPVAVAMLLTGASIAAAAIPALRASRLTATSFR